MNVIIIPLTLKDDIANKYTIPIINSVKIRNLKCITVQPNKIKKKLK